MATVDLFRDRNIYIANTVKCRPPQNRTPLEDEAMACLPYLRAQGALIQPQIIVCLGKTAAMYVIDREIRITGRSPCSFQAFRIALPNRNAPLSAP